MKTRLSEAILIFAIIASGWTSVVAAADGSLRSQAAFPPLVTHQRTSRKTYSYGDSYTQVDVCEGSIVEVTEIMTLCTSPYTFYYSGDGHSSSRFCDYGDKAEVTVKLLLNEDIDSLDDFYITMAAYDPEGNFLDTTGPSLLCKNFVNANDCATAGVYGFTTKLNLRSHSHDLSNFIPIIEMAFTSGQHSGLLGAVNVENCDNIRDFWVHRQRFDDFMEDHGLITFTCITMLGMAIFILRRARALKDEDVLARTASLVD